MVNVRHLKVLHHILLVNLLAILVHVVAKDATVVESDITHPLRGYRATLVLRWGFRRPGSHMSQHAKFQSTIMVPKVQAFEVEIE